MGATPNWRPYHMCADGARQKPVLFLTFLLSPEFLLCAQKIEFSRWERSMHGERDGQQSPKTSKTHPRRIPNIFSFFSVLPSFFFPQKNQVSSRANRLSTQHEQEPQQQTRTFDSYSMAQVGAARWTPPLSPSSKSIKHSSSSFSSGDNENRAVLMLSPRGALKVLKSPGVPPLDDLRQMRTLVGAASRTWLRDFLIRGGR